MATCKTPDYYLYDWGVKQARTYKKSAAKSGDWLAVATWAMIEEQGKTKRKASTYKC